MKNSFSFLVFAAVLIFSPILAHACDLCSIYRAVESGRFQPGTNEVGLAQQFTNFDELREHGQKLDNPEDQFLRSSITQIYGARYLSERFALQANLPLIYRSYRRFESGSRESGHETGIGDLSLIGRWRAIDQHSVDWVFGLELAAGIKLPTGDSDRIREELGEGHEDDHAQEDEEEHDDHAQVVGKHAGEHHGESEVVSAVHGHDLALGSGSVDFPLGVTISTQYGRALASASLQYVIRTEGRFDYRYENDLLWQVGVGAFLLLDDSYSLAAKVNLSGEYKPEDSLNGEELTDTYARAVFIGPQLIFAQDSGLYSELALDLPLDIETKEPQVAQTSRVRFALGYRF